MTSFAIIKTGGKQYPVAQGDTLRIEKIEGEVGSSVVLPEVLLAINNDNVQIGTPMVAGASVKATILEQAKGPKIHIVKFKPKVRYRRNTGHRQLFTKVEITDIKN